ncbi:uncharacterized protein FYW61_003786 [Anableps anableps]
MTFSDEAVAIQEDEDEEKLSTSFSSAVVSETFTPLLKEGPTEPAAISRRTASTASKKPAVQKRKREVDSSDFSDEEWQTQTPVKTGKPLTTPKKELYRCVVVALSPLNEKV